MQQLSQYAAVAVIALEAETELSPTVRHSCPNVLLAQIVHDELPPALAPWAQLAIGCHIRAIPSTCPYPVVLDQSAGVDWQPVPAADRWRQGLPQQDQSPQLAGMIV